MNAPVTALVAGLTNKPFSHAAVLDRSEDRVIEVYRPYIRGDDLIPRPVEPGQLHHWGRILYDTGAL
jgi:hypothetical protein